MAKKNKDTYEDWPSEEDFAREEMLDEREMAGEEEDECDGNCECCAHSCEEDKATEYLNLAKQVQADFDNYRKRNIEAVKNARNDGKIEIIEQILPCADALDRALALTTDEVNKKGLEMVLAQFNDVLAKAGVTRFDCKDTKFDPSISEAIATLESEVESGMVIEQLQCGYKLGDKIIRYAKVVVAK